MAESCVDSKEKDTKQNSHDSYHDSGHDRFTSAWPYYFSSFGPNLPKEFGRCYLTQLARFQISLA